MKHERNFDNVLSVVRVFAEGSGTLVTRQVQPAIEEGRYLPLTRNDAQILLDGVGNLRRDLTITERSHRQSVQQRDELHTMFTKVTDKFSSIDPLWNENPLRDDAMNACALIDTLLASAGVLRDDAAAVNAQQLRDAADYIDEENERHALYIAQVKEDMGYVLDTLERVLDEAQAPSKINDIQNAIATLKDYVVEGIGVRECSPQSVEFIIAINSSREASMQLPDAQLIPHLPPNSSLIIRSNPPKEGAK